MGDPLPQCPVCQGFVASDDTWVVACDTCSLWVHYNCTRLTKELFFDIENRPWICQICEEDPDWDLKPFNQNNWMDSDDDASQTSDDDDGQRRRLPSPGHLIWAKLGTFPWQPAIVRDNAPGCSDSFWVKWLDPKYIRHYNSEVLKKEMTWDFGLNFAQKFQMQLFKKRKDYRASIVLAIRLYWRAIGRPLPRAMTHWDLLSKPPTDPGIFITEQCYIEELFGIQHKPVQKRGHQVNQQIRFNCYVCHCGKPFADEKDWHKHLEDPDMERCGWCITKVERLTQEQVVSLTLEVGKKQEQRPQRARKTIVARKRRATSPLGQLLLKHSCPSPRAPSPTPSPGLLEPFLDPNCLSPSSPPPLLPIWNNNFQSGY